MLLFLVVVLGSLSFVSLVVWHAALYSLTIVMIAHRQTKDRLVDVVLILCHFLWSQEKRWKVRICAPAEGPDLSVTLRGPHLAK